MLRLRRPTAGELDEILVRQAREQPRYPAVGSTIAGDTAPPGYRFERFNTSVGRGDDVWERAVGSLKQWGPHRRSGMVVAADGDVAEGTTVVLAAPLPLGYAVAACRVVAVVDRADVFGFAYGTLPLHPEEGEEFFAVRRAGDEISFEIVVFSRPHDLLVRMSGPVAVRLQQRATRRYLAAMRTAATETRA